MEDRKYPILVVKMNAQPLPTMEEKKNQEWVKFGDKNEYPEYLLKLYNEGSKHRAIINGKCNYIFGKGLEPKGVLSTYDKALANDFVMTSEYGEGMDVILKKIIKDEEIYGGFYVEIVWSKSGKKVASRKHIDYNHVRSNADNTEFYYTKNWTKKLKDGRIIENRNPQEEEDFEVYGAYDPENRTGKQLFFYKSYNPDLGVYPLPGYLAAIKAVETDIEITNYHYNNLKNGFTATVLINFNNGVPTPEEMEEIEEQIKGKLTGTNNAGKFILSFADGKDKSAEVTVLSMSDADKQFEQLRKDITQEIFIGHGVTNPMLFGVMRDEGLGSGRSDLLIDNEIFQSRYVSNKQQVFEQFANSMADISGVPLEFELTKTDPIDLDWFGNDKLYALLTLEEKREKAGLPPLKEGLTNTTQTVVSEFASQNLAKKLNKIGESKDGYEVLASRSLEYDSFDRQVEKEGRLLNEGFAIETEIKTLERSILDLLGKEPGTSKETLAEVLNTTPKKVEQAINRLITNGLLKKNGEISNKGGKILDEKPSKTVNIFIRYEYAVRAGVSKPNQPIIETTRDFCREILGANKYYTLREINALSIEEGYDVFRHTGGFYNNNGTREYKCRHEWREVIVRKES